MEHRSKVKDQDVRMMMYWRVNEDLADEKGTRHKQNFKRRSQNEVQCLELVGMSMGERTLWYFKTSQKLATVSLPSFNTSSQGRQKQAVL